MNRIRSLREDLDLRQIDVANATGIDQKTLSNYETGKTNSDSYAIIRLAEFFHVSTNYLLGVTNYNFSSRESILDEISEMQVHLKNLHEFIKKNY